MSGEKPKATTVQTAGPKPGVNWIWLIVSFAVGVIIWFIPEPEGVDPAAWHLFAIFVATIAGIISKPLPMGAIAIIGLTATVLTGTLTINEALSGFSNSTIWLIVLAFFISRGFIKTGLGARIAYTFMRLLGRKTLGLSYGLLASDLVLAPAIPSNTARGGGILYPIIRSVADAYDSHPDDANARRIGSFLVFTGFQGVVITSAMFLTAMAANPLAVELAAGLGVEITWGLWAVAAIVPGIISLLAVPYLIFKLYPPEVKETPAAAQLAADKLEELGKITRNEWIMAGTFVLLIVLWIFGDKLGIHSTTTALLGLVVLLVSSVLTWSDVLKERGAWDTLVWFAVLVMMATFLNTLGFIPWFTDTVAGLFEGMNWVIAFLILSLIYFYSHYFFASNTAHVSAMYAPFLAVALAVGTPPLLAALVLAFFSNLMSSMTHYGTGPAPVFFGSGYVELGDWWKYGLIISVVNIIIWLGIGGVWYKIIGLW